MNKLNFPEFNFQVRTNHASPEIFDEVRRRWIALTPEEWVRQHVIKWLHEVRNYPVSLMAVEKQIRINGMQRRCDVICYNSLLTPLVIVECKAPEIKITQDVFDQAARYNLIVGARYFLLTNGLQHYCCELNPDKKQWSFLKELPSYK